MDGPLLAIRISEFGSAASADSLVDYLLEIPSLWLPQRVEWYLTLRDTAGWAAAGAGPKSLSGRALGQLAADLYLMGIFLGGVL